ncbi:hypothetical protein DM02DRAFT_658119 [Periconia macrospinosa]|uniref:Cytochrome P450 n=1 Tax=Periconia macrospinosa TaxID=97972 RepID=A0A2V1DI57_9PLEO|nr:hypothetical protein DM02DRAFT_658119 [Periconia macrospinosa]
MFYLDLWPFFQPQINPLDIYQPIRKLVIRCYGTVMDRLIGKALESRYEEYKRTGKSSSKPAVSLALDSIHAEKQDIPQQLDKSFMKNVTHQLRLFLFAGHDTSQYAAQKSLRARPPKKRMIKYLDRFQIHRHVPARVPSSLINFSTRQRSSKRHCSTHLWPQYAKLELFTTPYTTIPAYGPA